VLATWVVVLGILMTSGAVSRPRGPLDGVRLPFPAPSELMQIGGDIELKVVLSALVGTAGTWLAVVLASARARSLITAGLMLVAGLLPVFIAPKPAILFVLWQTGVAAAIAYGLCTGVPAAATPAFTPRPWLPSWRTAAIAGVLAMLAVGAGFAMLSGSGPAHTIAAHKGYVAAVAFVSNGTHAVSAGEDQTLKLSNLSDGQLLRSFTAHTKPVAALAAAKDGRSFLSGGQDYLIARWDVEKTEPVTRFRGQDGHVTAVAISPDGRFALSGGYTGTLRYFSLAGGGVIRTLATHSSPVRAIAFSPDGRRAISGGGSTLLMWDVVGDTPGDRGTLLGDRPLHRANHDGHELLAVAYAPDGSQAVAGTSKGFIAYWEIEKNSFKPRHAFTAHGDRVSGAVLLRDGRRLVTSGYDGVIRLWDVNAPKELAAFHGQKTGITALAVSPDERKAVSAGADGTLMVWNLPQK
jgi:WD40 repeat protein